MSTPLVDRARVQALQEGGYPVHKRHIAHIMRWYPAVLDHTVLDLGSGTGRFITQVVEAGGICIGVEPSQELIDESLARAQSLGMTIDVRRGTGEEMPFDDEAFGFVNMAEVIEHVQDPEKTLQEVYRVLKPGGGAYMSVPNRFGFYDPHYHVYFVNWLPRMLATPFLRIFGKEKDFSHGAQNIGMQRLDEMHYFTYGAIKKLSKKIGFGVLDTREEKLRSMLPRGVRMLGLLVYRLARPLYFNTFHVGLVKR